jgi:hypothetical protein
MGATLSIVNDTNCAWSCKIGPDQAAMDIFATTAMAVGVAVAVVATAGNAALLASALAANGVTHILGISTAAATSVTTAAASAAIAGKLILTAVDLSAKCSKAAAKELEKEGYVTIEPGSCFNLDLPTSLWQQCHCTRIWYDAVNRQVVTEHIYMRPIFSAALVGETKSHRVDWWKQKPGHFSEDRKDVHSI